MSFYFFKIILYMGSSTFKVSNKYCTFLVISRLDQASVISSTLKKLNLTWWIVLRRKSLWRLLSNTSPTAMSLGTTSRSRKNSDNILAISEKEFWKKENKIYLIFISNLMNIQAMILVCTEPVTSEWSQSSDGSQTKLVGESLYALELNP